MCQSELGPGTEYGRLKILAGQFLVLLKGSSSRNVLRTLSLVTRIPLLLKLPQTICTPENGASSFICLIIAIKSLSLTW